MKSMILIVGVVILLAVGLAGCAAEGAEPTPTVVPEPAVQPEPQPEVGPTPTTEQEPRMTPDPQEEESEQQNEVDLPETGELNGLPPELVEFADEWPHPNRDIYNTRATFDAEIDSGNIDELEVAWVFPIPGIAEWGGAASSVVIANDVVYFQDLLSNVFALNIEDGSLVWDFIEGQGALGPNGPAIGYGKVIAQGSLNEIFAVDIETGEEVWRTLLMGPTGSQAPSVYGGYVLTATSAGAIEVGEPGPVVARRGYAGGTSGRAYALDQETGEIVWGFQVVEPDFWGNAEVNSGGGIWYPPAVDPELGLTYWTTGNPAPFPGTLEWPNGSSRPGDNLYTNAMLALSLHEGELVWFNQVKPFDLFDLDFQAPPILTTIENNGEDQRILVGSGKLGIVYGFDPETGDILWETWIGRHENDWLTEVPMGEVVEVYPGVWGGVETPMALAEGVVYALTLNLSTPYTATGWDAADGGEAVAQAEGRTILREGTAEVYAIDITNGDILWSVDIDQPAFGGVTVVNDLVITASIDGQIRALLREDGSQVWSYQAPGGIIAWPAVAGDTLVYPVGIGREPVLLALRLGAGPEVQLTPEGQPTPLATPPVEEDNDDDDD
jgi:outer membrane protein assembly factor BamB